MPKVLISDKMSPLAAEILAKHNIDVDVKTGLSPEELKEIIGEYDGLAIRSATKVTADIFSAAKKLKVVGRAGIGVDNIDQNAATDNGTVVMNTPFGNSITTAEHAIALLFAAARQIPQASNSTHLGKWEKSKFMGVEVTGKVLGLIGCGNIGAIVAKRALGLQMKVHAFDPFLSAERAADLGVTKMELDEVIASADFITLHVPLNDSTKNIISKDALAKMKKGAFVINCARGGLVDEAALKDALDSGHIAGAALDVYEVEPAKENILFGHEKIVCTPHLGASTKEAQENVAVQVAEQIADYLNDNVLTNSLNIPAVSPEDAKLLNPYLKLGDILGSFAGQISGSAIKDIKISYQGKVTKLNTKPVSAILIQKILTAVTAGVNMVNCRKVAANRGIEISEILSDKKADYATYINIDITTDGEPIHVAGAIFNGEPRIVEVNHLTLEANIANNMLYIKNADQPGFIGELGKICGDNNINIANFHLGRSCDQAGEAISLITVDSKVSEDLLNKINELSSVSEVRSLTF